MQDREGLNADLLRLVQGFWPGHPRGTNVSGYPVFRADCERPSLGSFIGGGHGDVESDADDGSEFNSLVASITVEVALEEQPCYKVGIEAFTEALRLISPRSVVLVPQVVSGEIETCLPDHRVVPDTVQWDTPWFSKDGLDRFTAKFQGLLVACLVPTGTDRCFRHR